MLYPPFLVWAAHVLLQAQQPVLLQAAHSLKLFPLDGAGWSVVSRAGRPLVLSYVSLGWPVTDQVYNVTAGGGGWADLMSIRLFRCGRSLVSARGKALSCAQSTLLFTAEQNDQHSRPCGESVEFY